MRRAKGERAGLGPGCIGERKGRNQQSHPLTGWLFVETHSEGTCQGPHKLPLPRLGRFLDCHSKGVQYRVMKRPRNRPGGGCDGIRRGRRGRGVIACCAHLALGFSLFPVNRAGNDTSLRFR